MFDTIFLSGTAILWFIIICYLIYRDMRDRKEYKSLYNKKDIEDK